MINKVFDKKTNTYFKSVVYAIINSGWYEKRLVIVEHNGENYFKFYDYLDKENSSDTKVMINTITHGGFTSEFEVLCVKTKDPSIQLDKYKDSLDESIMFFEFCGYKWIFENKLLLTKLLKGEMVSIKEFEDKIIDFGVYRLNGWNYIETKEDIDFIMKETAGFHDSCIVKLNYTSGSYVNDENAMICVDNVRCVTMDFDSQWCNGIELVFENVISLNLRPSLDNYSSNIYEITLFVKDYEVYFYDSSVGDIDEMYQGTWLKSNTLRWRFLDKASNQV